MSITRRIVDTEHRLDETVTAAKKCANRIINACGEVRDERSLAEADFDNLLGDVAELCSLKTRCIELRRERLELTTGS